MRTLLALLLVLTAKTAAACCAIIVTAGGRPMHGTSATIAVARDGSHVVLSMVLEVPRTGTAQAVLIPLPGPMTPPRLSALDPAVLDRLLAETAPRLTAIADPDPCFPHPPIPPPAPELAGTGTFGAAGRPDYALFADAGAELARWLAARGLPQQGLDALGPDGRTTILALNVPASTGTATAARAAVQLRYDAAQVTVPGLPHHTDVTLLTLTRSGRIEPVNGASRDMTTGLDLPEFVLEQFGHFYAAAVSHQVPGVAAVTEFAGASASPDLAALGATWAAPASAFVTRLHVLRSADLTLGETSDTAPFRAQYRARIGWKGQYTLACSAGFDYRHALTSLWQAESAALAALTGWRPDDIRRAMVAHWQRTRESHPD